MDRRVIEIPKGIRYLSEWKEFKLPETPTIIDKQITGCGFTEYCISCPENIILCSPRRILLENKEQQHTGQVYYVRNNLEYVLNIDNIKANRLDNKEDIDRFIELEARKRLGIKESIENNPFALDEERIEILKEIEKEKKRTTAEHYSHIRENVKNYLRYCRDNNIPCKLLVTYDSFRHIKEALVDTDDLKDFYVVIDEFQSIFSDSVFKSTTEIALLNQLKGINRLCYVSATPMIDDYLEMLDDFKSLPFIKFDWGALDPGRVTVPRLNPIPCSRVVTEAGRIIEDYLSGKFEIYSYRDSLGIIHEVRSNEAVLYMNSVKDITELIKRHKLTPNNTNVLCSNTEENLSKIKKAFKASCGSIANVRIGPVPKKGEPHKMFTLCTRTVYLGADFYSTCARSFIFSDANLDSLTVDISLDLPQILGRQRLEENPWKNSADLYFTPLCKKKKVTKEEFDDIIRKKEESSNKLLNLFAGLDPSDNLLRKDLIRKFELGIIGDHYKRDYVAVDEKLGVRIPVFNRLVMISDRRAFDIQQIDYKDRFTVFNTLKNVAYIPGSEKEIEQSLDLFNKLSRFSDKLRLICDLSDRPWFGYFLEHIPFIYSGYYRVIGPKRLFALRFRKQDIIDEYKKLVVRQDKWSLISEEVKNTFIIGQNYSKVSIKNILEEIYSSHGYNKPVKATDLSNFFDVKSSKFFENGKRVNGFLIIGIKDKDD